MIRIQMSDEVDNTISGLRTKRDSAILNLQVGTRLQLYTHRDTKPVEHFSTLIGYVQDEYLLVKVPVARNVPVSLYDGENVTVRCFTGMSICTFQSNVIRTFLHPLYYMHLDFPRQIENVRLRAATRVKVNITAIIRLSSASGQASTANVELTDLSPAGALIESPRDFGTDDLIGLSFMLKHGEHETQISTDVVVRNAKVRTAASAEEHDIHTYGVQFLDVDPMHHMLLQILTYDVLLTDRKNIA